ncbi:hypothetical protein NMY22_g15391 [Coprinellus aureogranulatus]|nr:hypothetical protein NMY22_g15391 [Coprinellus aureogranulatus]
MPAAALVAKVLHYRSLNSVAIKVEKRKFLFDVYEDWDDEGGDLEDGAIGDDVEYEVHNLKPGEAFFALKPEHRSTPKDMRECHTFVVQSIHQRKRSEDIWVVAFPLYRYCDQKVKNANLGFAWEVLGEGELILSNKSAAVNVNTICGVTHVHVLEPSAHIVPKIPHIEYWIRFQLNEVGKGQSPRISEFRLATPGNAFPITLTCLEALHPEGRTPYSPNRAGTEEVFCLHCEHWIHWKCAQLGRSDARWVNGQSSLVANLKRAPILRGRWWGEGERSDWMVGGSAKYLIDFRANASIDNLVLNASSNDTDKEPLYKAMGSKAIVNDYAELDSILPGYAVLI